jgi:hypothetical protein
LDTQQERTVLAVHCSSLQVDMDLMKVNPLPVECRKDAEDAAKLLVVEDKNWGEGLHIHRENKVLDVGILHGYYHIVVGIQLLDKQMGGIHRQACHLGDGRNDQRLILMEDTNLQAYDQKSSGYPDIQGGLHGS